MVVTGFIWPTSTLACPLDAALVFLGCEVDHERWFSSENSPERSSIHGCY
jgi:hypothetical protein